MREITKSELIDNIECSIKIITEIRKRIKNPEIINRLPNDIESTDNSLIGELEEQSKVLDKALKLSDDCFYLIVYYIASTVHSNSVFSLLLYTTKINKSIETFDDILALASGVHRYQLLRFETRDDAMLYKLEHGSA